MQNGIFARFHKLIVDVVISLLISTVKNSVIIVSKFTPKMQCCQQVLVS